MVFPDALRAIAALMVILPHSVGLFATASPTWLDRLMMYGGHIGHRGVEIFFVLSGFVIAHSIGRKRMTPGYFGTFVLRRSVRLDPPYWVAIALMSAYLWFRARYGNEPVDLPSTAQVLAHLFYVQDVLGYGNINVVFWTLCIEIQFYLVFCLVLAISQRLGAGHGPRQHVLFLVLFLVSLAWPAGVFDPRRVQVWFVPHWYGFLAGCLAYFAACAGAARWTWIVAGLAAWSVALARWDSKPVAVALTATLLVIAAFANGLYTWLKARPLQMLGRSSYCIYLVHVPIAGVILGVKSRLGVEQDWISVLFLLLVMAASVSAAYVLHRLVEVPCLRLSQRLKVLERNEPAAGGEAGGVKNAADAMLAQPTQI